MEAKEKEILNELISGTKCQFVIPVFQRNYDWRIKDCQRLFNDIVELAKDKENLNKKHFIGAFVCKFNKFVDTSFNQYILIDGQQRLTSITLILKALYDYLGKFGDTYEETRAEINETYLINKFAKDSNFRLKLKPNHIDNDNFNRLMNNETVEVESIIGRNYHFFKEQLARMKISVDSFYNALQRLEGVVVFLDDSDNPQVIFESLNSTGLELTDVDLIRNYLLMNCSSVVQEKLYKEYWLKIEEILGDSFLAFIRDFLSLKNGIVTPSAKNAVYASFQKYYRGKNYEKEAFLKELYELAKIYSRLIETSEAKNSLSKALNDYISLDIKTTYPFVFALLIDNTPDAEGKKRIDDETLEKIIRLLEVYLIRRNVCNLSGGGVSQVMASLYNDLREKHQENLYKNIYLKISSALISINTKAYFPKDEEFVRELKSRDMFHNRNIMYILAKIEKYKQGKEVVELDNLSIEHIMPQTLSKAWINYLNVPDWKKQHDEYVHKIGNLTLTAYNSEMSNKLYEEKKSHIDFSRLFINQYLKSIEKWNINEIEKRAEYIGELAVSIWQYPKGNMEDISTESHFLMDEEAYDYSGTKPAGIMIKERKIFSNDWTELYVDSLRYLYEENASLFIALFTKEINLISKEKSTIRTPKPFVEDYYLELNNSTDRKIKILTKIFKSFQYEPEDIIVFIK